MEYSEFVDCCECGGFIDYDGYGYLACEEYMTDKVVYPSDVVSEEFCPGEYTHVVWFNR